MDVYSIVLCAGKGTRMQSELPKVVQPVAGYEMVNMVLKALNNARIENNNLILGYKKEEVISRIDNKFSFDHFTQEEQLGTGHAVLQAKEGLKDKDGITRTRGGSITYNAQTNSIKLVYNDGKKYIKTSGIILTKQLTSIPQGNSWVARPGYEELHTLREKLEGY